MQLVPVGKYHLALVSDKDYSRVCRYSWSALKGHGATIYAVHNFNGNNSMNMARFILGINDRNIFVDHKDMIGLNNMRSNIRTATNSDNQKNKKASGTSKYLGVSLHITKRKSFTKKFGLRIYISAPRWIAHIKFNNKYIHLGLFDNEAEAAIAYNKAAKKYHKKFARLNKIAA